MGACIGDGARGEQHKTCQSEAHSQLALRGRLGVVEGHSTPVAVAAGFAAGFSFEKGPPVAVEPCSAPTYILLGRSSRLPPMIYAVWACREIASCKD